MSIDRYRDDALYPRIVRAVEVLLARGTLGDPHSYLARLTRTVSDRAAEVIELPWEIEFRHELTDSPALVARYGAAARRPHA